MHHYSRWAAIASVYGAILCLLSTKLSLWLDEILQLIGTVHLPFRSLLDYIADNAGGVPLGYWTQAACLQIFGYSTFTARLPSIVFGVLSCLGVAVLACRAGLRRPVLCLLLFAALPLQVRYALEARPYEQALCITIWGTVLFLKLVSRPKLSTAIGYTLLAACGLYTQPFSVFVVLAHLGWLLATWKEGLSQWSSAAFLLAAGATLLASLLFLPWFLFAESRWHHSIVAAGSGAGIGIKTPLLILREVTGAGFPGTALILIFMFFGFKSRALARDEKTLWGLAIVVPLVLTLSGDLAFGYFFAIRQLIFILPALTLLAAFGFEAVMKTPRRSLGALGALALLLAFLYSDVRLFGRSRENWQKAADVLKARTLSGSCYLPLPVDSGNLYEFFQPSLGRNRCSSADLEAKKSVVAAISPYANKKAIQTTLDNLRMMSFVETGGKLNDEPQVQEWVRR